MSQSAKKKLQKYQIPLMNHRRYFGLFMASHSIPDCILVMHKGTGCKMKGCAHIADYFHESFSQICWTEVSGVDILSDSHAMIEDTVLTSYRRRRPGIIAVATSSVIELTGFDIRESVAQLRPQVDCPLIYIPTSGYEGDMYDGIADFTMEIVRCVDWEKEPDPLCVNIFGYPFERYEMDHGANMRELKCMLEAVGLRPGSWFFSGQRAPDLLSAHRGALNVVFPYFAHYAGELESLSGRKTLVTDLPIGTDGAGKWLRTVALTASADEDTVEAYVQTQSRRSKLLLDMVRGAFKDIRVCIIQPTPMAAALYAMVTGLGMTCSSVALLDESLGGRQEFHAAVTRFTGKSVPGGVTILENPSLDEIHKFPELHLEKDKRKFGIIISPSVEFKGDLGRKLKIVELGSPSYYRHAIASSPFLGFEGTITLAQRILDAVASRH